MHMTVDPMQDPRPTPWSDRSWAPGSIARLCNVPWDSSYRDIVAFENIADRDAYLDSVDSTAIRIEKLTLCKYGQPIRINIPFSTANAYNYVVVDNPLLPVPGENSTARRRYCYFISAIDYLSPNTTILQIELDVWTTYADVISFGQCYVERGHAALASLCRTKNYRLYANVPEGIDIGSEYMITSHDFRSFLSDGVYVIIASTARLSRDNPNFGDISNPKLQSAHGGTIDNMPCGEDVIAMTWENFNKFGERMEDYPWVTQCITAIYVVPRAWLGEDPGEGIAIEGVSCRNLNNQQNTAVEANIAPIEIDDDFIETHKNRYRNVLKLKAYPYSFMMLENFDSSPLIVKKQNCLYYSTDGGRVQKLFPKMVTSLAPPSMEARLEIDGYNAAGESQDVSYHHWPVYYGVHEVQAERRIDYGEGLDFALKWSQFPQISLINNQATLFLAQNAHRLEWENQQAEWSQQKALAAANNSYTNAQVGVNQANQMTNLNNTTSYVNRMMSYHNDMENLRTQTYAGAATGAVNFGLSAATGNVIGAASTLASTPINLQSNWNVSTNNMALQNSINALDRASSSMANDINNRATMDVAGNNRALATYAANGDYQAAIAGIQARVQDARLTPPSISGTAGGSSFNLSTGYYGLNIVYKTLETGTFESVGEYFLRYGYGIERTFVPPQSLMCCEKFTYWRMKSVYLFGNAPEDVKQTIRGIFEKGVTVWKSPADIGIIDLADNEPIREVFYS